jgi:DNA-binding CsgD family transcriptional regulator
MIMTAPNLERRERIRTLRLAGMTLAEIACEVKVSRCRVSQYVMGMIRRGEISACPKEEQYRLQARVYKRKSETNLKREAKCEAALEMHKQGMTLVKIGEKLGCHATTVSHYLHRKGIPGRRVKPTLFWKQLIELRLKGLGYQEIADILGKSLGTVAVTMSRLIEKGLVPRGKRGQTGVLQTNSEQFQAGRFDAAHDGNSEVQPQAERIAGPA